MKPIGNAADGRANTSASPSAVTPPRPGPNKDGKEKSSDSRARKAQSKQSDGNTQDTSAARPPRSPLHRVLAFRGRSTANATKQEEVVSPEKTLVRKLANLTMSPETSSKRRKLPTDGSIPNSNESEGQPRGSLQGQISQVTSTLNACSLDPHGRIETQSEAALRDRLRPKRKNFPLLEALIAHDRSLLIYLVRFLSVPDLISLYAISKTFHLVFNWNATASVLANMRTWAPNADTIFPWRAFRSLCIKDPIQKLKMFPSTPNTKSPLTTAQKYEQTQQAQHPTTSTTTTTSLKPAEVFVRNPDSRDVPSLRWLQMAVWREGIAHDIIATLRSQGLLVPHDSPDALKRLWFTLDLRVTSSRLTLFRTQTYMTTRTLLTLTHIFLKLDMSFTDPGYPLYPPPAMLAAQNNPFHHPIQWANGAFVGTRLRQMLIAEYSLTPLWRVLKGWDWEAPHPAFPNSLPMSNLSLLRLHMRHGREDPNVLLAHLPEKPATALGLRLEEWGQMRFEKAGEADGGSERAGASGGEQRVLLIHPVVLVIGELVRREVVVQDEWLRMMMAGFGEEELKVGWTAEREGNLEREEKEEE